MPNDLRPAGLLLMTLLAPPALRAQASPYIALDDPRLPMLEHLIARGDVVDATPMQRPFRRVDAVRVLAAVDTVEHPALASLVRSLTAAWSDPTDETWYRVEGQLGTQGYTSARRDPLHPEGPGGVQPIASLGLQATLGSVTVSTRPTVDRRLAKDPDWPGRRNLDVIGWFPEAYISAQFRWAALFYGQMGRNWGPRGVPGIPLSDYAYPRPQVGFTLGTNTVRLEAIATQLEDQRDSIGELIHRYYFAHRIAVRLSSRVQAALWETTVIDGPDREFDGRYRNPVTLLVLANTYGLGARGGNTMIGADLRWRASRDLTLETQLAIDDIVYQQRGSPTRNPDRLGATLAASGPLGGRASWRALYTVATSTAFRAFNPGENFTDAGVGIGRNFADNDQATATVSMPVRGAWLLTPELTLLRQGEGRINDPYPARGLPRGETPELFIGTIERTLRAALGVSGRQGTLSLAGNIGFHHVTNADNIAGRTRDRVEGRVIATLGIGSSGRLP